MDIESYLPFITPFATCILTFVLNYFYKVRLDRPLKRIEQLINIFKSVPTGNMIQPYELEILMRLRIEIYESICKDLGFRIIDTEEKIRIESIQEQSIKRFAAVFIISCATSILFYILLLLIFQLEISTPMIVQIIVTSIIGSLFGLVLVSIMDKKSQRVLTEKEKTNSKGIQDALEVLTKYPECKASLDEDLGRSSNCCNNNSYSKDSDN